MRRPLLTTIFLALALVLLFYVAMEPRADRAWIPEQAQTATAVMGETITLHNVRDWTYSAEGPVTTDWTTVEINPKDIVRAWFLIEPFSDWEAVGHTFLSFELVDGRVYSFSVEARREQGEKYEALNGALRAYELSYQWGTERDFVTRRLLFLDHPLRLYPLSLSPEAASALFVSLIEETNTLAEQPRFYNTLTANCTNVLATIVNRHYPDTLPYDKAWHMTGYADEYLIGEGLIEGDDVAAIKAVHDLTPHRETVRTFQNEEPAKFSRLLRDLLN